MIADSTERIKQRWAGEGVAIRPGNTSGTLAAFEAKYGVVTPRAFRAYFEAVDGTGDDSDGEVIRFWPLAEVMPINEDCQVESAELGEWFLFADFMINSHIFAVRLTADPANEAPVASWDSELIPQARSFAVFLKRYLADRDSLQLHMPPTDRRWVDRDDAGSSA
jgi:hypothetical protein